MPQPKAHLVSQMQVGESLLNLLQRQHQSSAILANTNSLNQIAVHQNADLLSSSNLNAVASQPQLGVLTKRQNTSSMAGLVQAKSKSGRDGSRVAQQRAIR